MQLAALSRVPNRAVRQNEMFHKQRLHLRACARGSVSRELIRHDAVDRPGLDQLAGETTMGLMDVLNGMRNGPRGQVGSRGTGGGMSPITMGLLALLAYKAFKGGGLMGSAPQPGAPARPANSPNQTSGGSTDWLSGLGGMLAGGAAGSVLTGGLGELVKRFQQNGQGQVAHSWVGTGHNETISPGDLEQAVGLDTLDDLSRQTGTPRDQLLAELAEQLPQTVDTLTPEGRIPNEQEASRWV
jgi:uncharacterized protein YidB (DUF937 family)